MGRRKGCKDDCNLGGPVGPPGKRGKKGCRGKRGRPGKCRDVAQFPKILADIDQSGMYPIPKRTEYIEVRLAGAGGSGAGTYDTGTGFATNSGGGGSGGYCEFYLIKKQFGKSDKLKIDIGVGGGAVLFDATTAGNNGTETVITLVDPYLNETILAKGFGGLGSPAVGSPGYPIGGEGGMCYLSQFVDRRGWGKSGGPGHAGGPTLLIVGEELNDEGDYEQIIVHVGVGGNGGGNPIGTPGLEGGSGIGGAGGGGANGTFTSETNSGAGGNGRVLLTFFVKKKRKCPKKCPSKSSCSSSSKSSSCSSSKSSSCSSSSSSSSSSGSKGCRNVNSSSSESSDESFDKLSKRSSNRSSSKLSKRSSNRSSNRSSSKLSRTKGRSKRRVEIKLSTEDEEYPYTRGQGYESLLNSSSSSSSLDY